MKNQATYSGCVFSRRSEAVWRVKDLIRWEEVVQNAAQRKMENSSKIFRKMEDKEEWSNTRN